MLIGGAGVALALVGGWLAVRAARHGLEDRLRGSVDADVQLATFELDLWSAFPRASVRATDVRVVGRAPFAGVPLLTAAEASGEVDLASLFRDAVHVTAVHLVSPKVVLLVDPEGRSNADIFPPSEGGGGGAAQFEDVRVDDLALTYNDPTQDVHVQLSDLDLAISAAVDGAGSALDGTLAIGALTATSGGVTWLSDTRWTYAGKASLDPAGALTLTDTKLGVNALSVQLSGGVTPGDDGYALDLALSAADTSFATLLSLVPAAYAGDLKGVDSAGTLRLDGTVKGLYSTVADVWPALDLALGVDGARFRYPDLPSAVEGITLAAKLHHPGGPADALETELGSLAFTVAGSPFTARGTVVHPFTDPVVDMAARGHLDLFALRSALPLPEGTAAPRGAVDVDVSFAGAASDFQKGDLQRVRAAGTVKGAGLKWRDAATDVAWTVSALDVELTPAGAGELRALSAVATSAKGESDVAARGRLDNLLAWMVGDNALIGAFTVTSDRFDLRPFQGDDGDVESEEDDGLIVAVPGDLALTVDLDLGEVVTERITLDQVKGRMYVRDGAVKLQDVRSKALGGTVRLNGEYRAATAEEADVDLAVNAVKVSLPRLMRSFPTAAKIAPMLEGAAGALDLDLTVASKLARDGTPALATARSEGTIGPTGVKVSPSSLRKPATDLGDAGFAALDLGGSALAYAMKGGRVKLAPAKVKLGSVASTLRGSVGLLDRSLDLALDFPVQLVKLKKGTPLATAAASVLGKKVEVTMAITGSYDDPDVRLGLR